MRTLNNSVMIALTSPVLQSFMGHAHGSEGQLTALVQDILHIMHEMKEMSTPSHLLSHSVKITGVTPDCNAIDSIDLPSPRPLLPSLLEAGLGHEISVEISRTYQHCAEELGRRMRESVVTTCRGIAGLPVVTSAASSDLLIRKVVSTFTELYLRRLDQWKEEIIQRMKQASKSSADIMGRRNARTFNHEYIPLFEHFFEENPFPTHADKMSLAKRSNMQYRQIHVWFQNRRNRTRKEGKTLSKKHTNVRAAKPLDNPYESMKGRMADSGPRALKSVRVDSSEGIIENDMSKDAFASSSPPHAFPSLYPPICHYDPFPCKNGPTSFGKPSWRRAPGGKYTLTPSTSIDNLVEKFSRLNVRDGTFHKEPLKSESRAATLAITVTPSRAPHPSLIVHKHPQLKETIRLLPSVRAPVSRSNAFQSPSPSSTPVTLVPTSTQAKKSELPGKRKTAPLPRRFSGRMGNIRRDTTPSGSPSTSSSPRLFSTDTESQSCSFSSLGSMSTPSDATSIQELPHLFRSPCRSPFDSPIPLRSLGNMILPSSVP